MPLLLLFVIVPLVEIALFIQVGGWIGLWPTLLIIVVTAVLGTFLLRQQGRNALLELQSSFSELRNPTAPLAHGALIIFGGAMLLTPGFFTDALGLGLMVPRVREAVMGYLRRKMHIVSGFSASGFTETGRPAGHPDIIDAEVIEGDFTTPDDQDQRHPSGWTKR